MTASFPRFIRLSFIFSAQKENSIWKMGIRGKVNNKKLVKIFKTTFTQNARINNFK